MTASTAPPLLHNRYRLLRTVGADALSRVMLVRDTHAIDDPLRLLHKINLHSQDSSLVYFGTALLTHKARTLQELFDQLDSAVTLHDAFAEGSAFYVVQSLVKGRALLQRSHSSSRPRDQQAVAQLLGKVLLLLQQVHDQGLGCCCLFPSDIVLRESDGRCCWTGMGVFKSIAQQILLKELPREKLFPGDAIAYFAPEFIEGQFHIGTDLYTLGMIAAQLLTQQPLAHLTQSEGHPLLRRDWADSHQIAPPLRAIVSRLSAPQPQRYATVEAVLSDLGELLKRAETSPANPPSDQQS